MLDPTHLRNILLCSLCRRPLQQPTTLPCGHTVCAAHQTVPCPLPQCAPTPGPSRPRIPPTSRIIALLDSVLATGNDDDDDPPVTPTVRHRPDSPSPPGRPRKRQRMRDSDDDPDGDLLSHLRAAALRERLDAPLPDPPLEKELHSELACEICFMLLYNPVTTPCQHTFCAKCLHRALDHSNLCPLCRDSLPAFSFFEDHPGNETLETLLLTAFPEEYAARAESIAAEERDARLDTPIFVCMLIFPGSPTALHFFEPRYRLMLRRCLEQPVPSFGMIMPARQGAGQPQTDYGTMLEVRSVQMLADGRSMVETWSTFRFRILERGTLDGYTVARIERIDDVPDLPSSALNPGFDGPTNEQLMDTCTQFLHQLRRGTAPWVVQRLNNVYGAPPTDPAQFAYWVALVLPIDEFEKAKLLPIRSARLRLNLVVHWIEQLSNNWWFTSGCVVF
ncbi:PUA-like domain-containing protein [Mycena galopus ATCC 62051]|nr:PUA-like domain-containing protein [Mycena galopus ATCC 62051]